MLLLFSYCCWYFFSFRVFVIDVAALFVPLCVHVNVVPVLVVFLVLFIPNDVVVVVVVVPF